MNPKMLFRFYTNNDNGMGCIYIPMFKEHRLNEDNDSIAVA